MSVGMLPTLSPACPRPGAARPYSFAVELSPTSNVIGHSGVKTPVLWVATAQIQKDVKMKVDPNELLKTKGKQSDIMSYANELLKTNGLWKNVDEFMKIQEIARFQGFRNAEKPPNLPLSQ